MRSKLSTLTTVAFVHLYLFASVTACSTSPQVQQGASAFETASPRSPSSDSKPQTSSRELEREMAARFDRVDAFRFLEEYGRTHGLRIYAAGGTAVGYGSYVNQHLENEALKKLGRPPRYFDSRFSYDYYDIFRSTQDADIVIDIPGGDVAAHEKAAQALESVMRTKFTYLQGSKSVWEVRFLRVDRGTAGTAGHKDAILGWDFQHQNTDSYSTGLFELTTPPAGESRVRDVKHWELLVDTPFLEDLSQGKIRFYLEPEHSKTARAKQGMNPEILSVIRFYTKAFQYGAVVSDSDRIQLQSLITRFDPNSASTDSYLVKQITNNGLKLYWHAIDVERASKELDRVGLKSKLIVYGSRADASLSNWLKRKPLASFPLGSGDRAKGKTAAELIREGRLSEILTHETNQFLAYENITRAADGYLNVFESVAGQFGQQAVHGDGFYLRQGREGARGTGFSIRVRLDPLAVNGVDFDLVDGDYVVLKNRRAATVIDESLNLSLFEFVRLLFNQNGVDKSDLGLFTKMLNKTNVRGGRTSLNANEAGEIDKLLKNSLKVNYDKQFYVNEALRVWFSLPVSVDFPEIVEMMLESGTADPYKRVVVESHSGPTHFVAGFLAEYVFSNDAWSKRPDLMKKLISTLDGMYVEESIPPLIEYAFTKEAWFKQDRLVDQLLDKVDALYRKGMSGRSLVNEKIVEELFMKPNFPKRSERISRFVREGKGISAITQKILSSPDAVIEPEWLKIVTEGGWANWPGEARLYSPYELFMDAYTGTRWQERPDILLHWISRNIKDLDKTIDEKLLYSKDWNGKLAKKSHWADHPQLRAMCNGRTPTAARLRAAMDYEKFRKENHSGLDRACVWLLRSAELLFQSTR